MKRAPGDYLAHAMCVMCGNGVGEVRGRVVCEACELPTDCCLCPEKPALAARRAVRSGVPALAGGATTGALPAVPRRPRLAEEITTSGCRPAPWAARGSVMPAAAVRKAVVIVADSASIYTSALRELGYRIDPLALPNLLPPYDRCFVEMRGGGSSDVAAWGAYLARVDLAGRAAEGGRRWLVRAGLVVRHREGPPMGPVLRYQLVLDDLGRLVAGRSGAVGSTIAVMPPRTRRRAAPIDPATARVYTSRCFNAVVLSLALLNCRGASLEPLHLPALLGGRAARLRPEPFASLVAEGIKSGLTTVEAARRVLPGRFVDERLGAPGGTRGAVRWEPSSAATASSAGARGSAVRTARS